MVHLARLGVALTFLVVCLLIRGVLPEDTPVAADQPGTPAAASNQQLVEGLTVRWQQLPDVLDAHAGLVTGRDGRTGVVGFAVCRTCNLLKLRVKLARDVWWSELVDISSFTVTAAHDDDHAHALRATFDPVKQAKLLYDKFGNGFIDPDTGKPETP